jgi:hypothetical protein
VPSKKGQAQHRAHRQKTRDVSGFAPYMAFKVCETCGKQCYPTREAARQSARVNHPGQAMHIYWCREASGRKWWHLSSMPAARLAQLRDRERG